MEIKINSSKLKKILKGNLPRYVFHATQFICQDTIGIKLRVLWFIIASVNFASCFFVNPSPGVSIESFVHFSFFKKKHSRVVFDCVFIA